MKNQLENWHEFVATQNTGLLDEILADDVKFHSPFVWKPKEGKQMTTAILITAMHVFKDFRYVRQIKDAENCLLEFEARVGELTLRGVDIIEFGEDGKFTDFEVMIRPANALQALAAEMSKRLSEQGLI